MRDSKLALLLILLTFISSGCNLGKEEEAEENEVVTQTKDENQTQNDNQYYSDYFVDNGDGTVIHKASNLLWNKCSHGQTWNSGLNACVGSPISVEYCSTNDDSCNNNNSVGNLTSGEAYDACAQLNIGLGYANKTTWRVPTLEEARSFIFCKDDPTYVPGYHSDCDNDETNYVEELFPNTFVDRTYYTSTSNNFDRAWHLSIDDGKVSTYANSSKTWKLYVRCVADNTNPVIPVAEIVANKKIYLSVFNSDGLYQSNSTTKNFEIAPFLTNNWTYNLSVGFNNELMIARLNEVGIFQSNNYTNYPAPASLPNAFYYSADNSHNGFNIMYAFGSSNGLYISDDAGATFNQFTTADGLGSTLINSVSYDSTSALYVATDVGVAIDIMGDGSGLNNYHSGNSAIPADWINNVFVTSDDMAFIATENGLAKTTNLGGSFDLYLIGEDVMDVYASNLAGNRIYAATSSGVYISVDGGANFVLKTTADGLASNTTTSIWVDSDGHIYVGTAAGISISTDGGNSFNSYSVSSGLPSASVVDVIVIE
jgi:hypothetical protein